MSIRGETSKFVETIGFLSELHKHRANSQLDTGMLDDHMVILRIWQSERLARTYADLLNNPRYSPACQFFLSDIYAPSDFSQRDHEIEYLYKVMSRFLPDFLISLVRKTVEMRDLTETLDQELLRALVDELGVTNSITPDLYAAGYRICNNYTERAHQIQLLVEIGHQVHLGTRLPLVSTTLRLARRPAQRAGWHELHDFLERGFYAFKRMHGAKEFLNTIYKREMRILDNIFSNDPNPFEIL